MSSKIYELTANWNNISQTFVAIGIDVTDTSSGSSSKLLDLKVGGQTKFSVHKSGGVGVGSVASGANSSAFGYIANAAALNAVAVGRSVFTHTTGLASVNFGILNNSSGATLNTTTGAITGTVTANTSQGRLTTAVGVQNSTNGNFSSAVGLFNTSSGVSSSAFGYSNTASQESATSVGRSNTASGYYSSAFGYSNTASEESATSVGRSNMASGISSSAIGHTNTASGLSSSAVGYDNTASGNNSSAFGYQNTASGANSSVFGFLSKTTVANTIEMGYWSTSTTRGGSIRGDSTGLIQFTSRNSASAPLDGGATAGSEAAGTLGRGMFAIERNGLVFTLRYNDGGTIRSLTLGTVS